MNKHISRTLFIGCLFLSLLSGSYVARASLIGPWFRYDCNDLGFQIPVSTGWHMTQVPNGIVFAMQTRPDPYVRVAVGRIPFQGGSVDELIREQRPGVRGLQKTDCQVDGEKAIRVEGHGEDGPFMDLFVQKATYWYWIGFAADNQAPWPRYRKTFDIVLDGFHFL
jgi:hypothetical protein